MRLSNAGQRPVADYLGPGHVDVYHDESGSLHCDDYFLVGLLFIRRCVKDIFHQRLQAARSSERCYADEHEIHWTQLPKSLGGQWGAKGRVASQWVDAFYGWRQDVRFAVLCVNTGSCDLSRHFPDEARYDYAYNRFTSMALLGGLRWFLQPGAAYNVKIYSDEKSRSTKRARFSDNFERYLPSSLRSRMGLSEVGSHIDIDSPVVVIPSKGNVPPDQRQDQEFIQLTDVLLGVIRQCVYASSSKQSHKTIAKRALPWLEDLRLEPWRQQFDLHRKLSVGFFPSLEGRVYTEHPLALSRECGQLGLGF